LPCEIENGPACIAGRSTTGRQKIFPTHPQGHSRELPIDYKLAASPRNMQFSCFLLPPAAIGRRLCHYSRAPLWICRLTRRKNCLGASALCEFPFTFQGGEGLGASRPDSINVGRIGAKPSTFVPRDLDGCGELLCSTGVSLFTGL